MNTAYVPLLLMLFLLILFTWNRWRYDLVAIFGLLLAVSLNIVPVEKAFLGFAHPAVILVAAALMISQALQSSGALEALLGLLPVEGRALPLQLLMVCSVTVFLSAFINNVAAVALMIPFVISLAYKSDRSARLYLMPIAFSSLLGGMITLIGTPPNIIIATFRGQLPDRTRFSMFDFTPIGLSISVIGLLFIAFAARFLITAPKSTQQESMLDTLRDFLTDMTVNQDSPLIGSTLREFIETHEEITVLGLRRDQKTQLFPSPYERFKENDILVIEAKSEAISLLSEEKGLSTQSEKVLTNFEEDEEVIVVEVIIPSQSKALGNSSKSLDFRWRYQVNVLGVARAGHRLSRSLSDVVFAVGDIILLQGTKDNINKTMQAMNWIFLKERTEAFKLKKKAITLPIGIFMVAILGSYFKLMDITIAFIGCALVYILLGYLKSKKNVQSGRMACDCLISMLDSYWRIHGKRRFFTIDCRSNS